MEIKTFGVAGAGQMGSGIAQVAALSGYDVIMGDISEQLVQKGLKNIRNMLAKAVEKEKIAQDTADEAFAKIKTSVDIKDFAETDFVVEAVTENEPTKILIFQDLDRFCPPETILATNTSSIPIGKIGSKTRRPGKVIGMHFMNPVPLMKLVEIIRSLATSDETFQTTMSLSKKLGKIPAEAQDYPGFISNRLLMPMVNEAVFALYEGVGTRESIDGVMKLGMNHPMGPLELADLIGLDTCLAIMETLFNGFKDSKYRPCPLLRKYVEAGWLGRKTGRGFYDY